jgi:hypothetical protein
VSSATAAATGTGSSRPEQPVPPPPPPASLARPLAWASAIGIGSSILIMMVASVAHSSAAVPVMPWPPGWPPLEIAGHLPVAATYAALWAAAVLGGGGVIAGLLAVSRGARIPAGLLIATAVVAVAIFAMLPPAGSTDTLNYATFGRIAVLGHNPYVMTPDQLHATGDPIGQLAYQLWRRHGSLYGPLATLEQHGAAELGGTSAARIVFWLKLWNAIVFLGIALALDRMLRSDPARRARAHLLWSVNPLVLWGLVAAGHLDVLAAAACFFGLILVRSRRAGAQPGSAAAGPTPLAAAAAGALVGVGVDFMLTYLLLAAALAWALRRRPLALLAAAAGFGVAFVPAYLWAGRPLLQTMLWRRGKVSADNFYQLFDTAYRHGLPPGPDLVVVLAFAAFALLMLWRLPDAVPDLPAIQPALAIGVAWLFIWYYQLPWYDTMIIALLALYPASRLDYVVVVQLMAGTFSMMPGGSPFEPPLGWLRTFSHEVWFAGAPLVLLAAVVAVVLLCVSGAWNVGPPTTIGSPWTAGRRLATGRPLTAGSR